MRDVIEVDPVTIVSYEGVRGENLIICKFCCQLETQRSISRNHFENKRGYFLQNPNPDENTSLQHHLGRRALQRLNARDIRH